MANNISPSTPPFVLKKTSYLSRDYLTLRDELLAKLPILTKGAWSDLSEQDPGIAMLETYFSSVDNLMFYQDMVGQEMDLDRARQRSNVISLLRLIGYETRGVSASTGTATVQVSPTDTPFYPVLIQKGTQFSAQGTNGQLIFTSTEQATLIGPTDAKTIPIVQGTQTTDIFISDGTPSQKFILSSSGVDKTTVQVFVDENPSSQGSVASLWSNVDNFFGATIDSKVYKTQVDEFSNVYVVFGDGQFGKVPPQNANITLYYIQTSGADGNVGKNSINKVVSGVPFVQDNKGNKVNLTVLNSQATAGGADIETIEEAKATALGLLFGLNRALSRGDFESLMLSVPGVSKAVAWGESEEQNPDYRLLNRVRACFFSNNFADMFFNPASRASYRSLRDNQVRALLTERMPISTRLTFVDPVLSDIFVSILIGVDINKFDPNIIIDQIRSNILDYYSLNNVAFGQDVRVSALLSLANSIDGVSWAKVTRLYTTPEGFTPDFAPNPPLDIILDKWKIPTFADSAVNTTQNTTVSALPPYLAISSTPTSVNIGQNDIKVVNPDTQSDILINGYTYYPAANIQHISITYTSVTDEPANGVFFGHPNPEADAYTYSSLN